MRPTDTDGRGSRSVPRVISELVSAFWCGKQRRTAWLVTVGSFGFELLNVALQLAVNFWSRAFFDAIERRSVAEVSSAALMFPVLAVAAVGAVVGAVVCKSRLQIHWRACVTDLLCDRWLSGQGYYRMNVLHGASIAPEHRIAEDARVTVDPVVDLTIGFTSAAVTFVLFVGVLWTVGGSISVGGYVIPGFMVFAAVGYSIIVWSAMIVVGAPYSQKVRDRSEAEARFRFELTRVRENAEGIALVRGEPGELRRLGSHYENVVRTWLQVVAVWGRMTWVSHGNTIVSPTVPLLLMAPKYLSGEASLGTVMQAAAAFASVQAAVGWFTANYARLSEWYAAASRLAEIDRLIANASLGAQRRGITMGTSPDGRLHLVNLSVALHDGRAIVSDADLAISQGEMVMVVGESGSGKSSLIRAIAGVWPWGSGRILLPVGATLSFLPQRPYIPIGRLADAVIYPKSPGTVADAEIASALHACGLNDLVPRLAESASWDKILSGGEQQRLAFARMLLEQPSIAVLDEATSALDEDSQGRLMELFRFQLAATTVISVSHRPSLAPYHTRQIVLSRELNGASVHDETGEIGSFSRMRSAWSLLLQRGAAAQQSQTG